MTAADLDGRSLAAEDARISTLVPHRTSGKMDGAEGRKELALLAAEREHLLSELSKLTENRKNPKGRMKGDGMKLEALQRMVGLVAATEQQLAGQGEAGLGESGPDHSSMEDGTEVRKGLRQAQPISF
jgi:hypothetical protein